MSIDTLNTEFPVCPICGFSDQDWWDGLSPKDDGDEWSANCPDCGTDYSVTLSVSATFSTKPAGAEGGSHAVD